MACPRCECKETYAHNSDDPLGDGDEIFVCAACGSIHWHWEELPEDDDEDATPSHEGEKNG